MLLKQLEYFAAVVDCDSFTKAAERCHVSQSAISQQVKALERELGCELLKRSGRRFAVTAAGEAALRAARDMLGRAEQLRSELEQLSQPGLRELRVGYLNRYEGWEVPSAIAAFALRHPEIAVSAVAGSHDDLYAMVLASEVDLIFNDRRRELSDEFANEYLMTCYTSVEVSEASPLAQRDQVMISQLADIPCILIARDEQRDIERAYYRDVLNFPCPFVFAHTMEDARMMVAGNRGFLPLESHSPTSPAGNVIKRIPLVGPSGQLKREYYAFWPLRHGNWAVKEFARMLKSLFE